MKGYRNALLTGFAIYFISSVMQIIAIKYTYVDMLLYSRFFCAFGASSGLICAFAIINHSSENSDNTHKLISMAFISLTFFSYLSITLSGFIIEYLGWNAVFYLILIASSIQIILIYNFIPNLKNLTSEKIKLKFIVITYIKAFYNLKLLTSSLIIAFTTTSTYLYNAIGASISINFFYITPKIFGILSMLNFSGLIIGGWLSTKMMRRYSTLIVLSQGLLLAFIPIGMFYIFHFSIFHLCSNGILFFFLITLLNLGLGIIYPAASFIALNSIKCNATASSIMNFIKISCPAMAITSLRHFHLGLIQSYKIPMLLFFSIAFFCLLMLKIINVLKQS